jgi:predicted negative regulator of RcsB-dependent stress response
MQTDVTQSVLFYRLWEWAEKRRKQLIWGLTVVTVVGFGIGYFFWHETQSEAEANHVLARLTSPANPNGRSADALVKLASDYPHTDAAGRAMLLAGAQFFVDNKFSEAQAQFDRYLREYRNGAFAGQASLGRAACLEQQGKTNDAINAYKDIAEHHPTDNVAPPARLALGRLYESLGNYDLAKLSYEQIVRRDSYIGMEAGVRLEAMLKRIPAMVPVLSSPSTNQPVIKLPNQ